MCGRQCLPTVSPDLVSTPPSWPSSAHQPSASQEHRWGVSHGANLKLMPCLSTCCRARSGRTRAWLTDKLKRRDCCRRLFYLPLRAPWLPSPCCSSSWWWPPSSPPGEPAHGESLPCLHMPTFRLALLYDWHLGRKAAKTPVLACTSGGWLATATYASHHHCHSSHVDHALHFPWDWGAPWAC